MRPSNKGEGGLRGEKGDWDNARHEKERLGQINNDSGNGELGTLIQKTFIIGKGTIMRQVSKNTVKGETDRIYGYKITLRGPGKEKRPKKKIYQGTGGFNASGTTRQRALGRNYVKSNNKRRGKKH